MAQVMDTPLRVRPAADIDARGWLSRLGKQTGLPDLRLRHEARGSMYALVPDRLAPSAAGREQAASQYETDRCHQPRIHNAERRFRMRCPRGLHPCDPRPRRIDMAEPGSPEGGMILH